MQNLISKETTKEQKKLTPFNLISKYCVVVYILISIFMFRQFGISEKFYIENGHGRTEKMNYFYVLLGMIYSAFVFFFMSWSCDGFIRKYANPKSKMHESKDSYHHRIKNMFYGLVYYSISTLLNFYLIYTYNPELLPVMLGGKLNVLGFMANWPQTASKPVLIFFIVSIGKIIFLN